MLCRYGEALDAAIEHGQVAIILSLVEELASRDGLILALKRRPEASLVKLFVFLNKYAAHPDHAALVMQVVNSLLDLHGEMIVGSVALIRLIDDLKGRVAAEVKLQMELQALKGPIEMLIG
jgi:hypothetical protein